MLQLSQKAWNNVVIFAMLFMLYLFSISTDMLNDGEPNQAVVEPLFPPFSVVMSMDFGVARLERIGQDWRLTNGELSVNQQGVDGSNILSRLVAIQEFWSSLEAIEYVAQPQSSPYIITIQLAGENKKRIYQLFVEQSGVLLKLNADWYYVDGAKDTDLFPVELIH